jgi:hypothetical protein
MARGVKTVARKRWRRDNLGDTTLLIDKKWSDGFPGRGELPSVSQPVRFARRESSVVCCGRTLNLPGRLENESGGQPLPLSQGLQATERFAERARWLAAWLCDRQKLSSSFRHVKPALAEPATRGVDGLRATGEVAEQSAKSVDELTPRPWVERESRQDRRSVLWRGTRFPGRKLVRRPVRQLQVFGQGHGQKACVVAPGTAVAGVRPERIHSLVNRQQ